MYGIFLQSVVIFKNYIGNGIIMPLFLLCILYLLFRERNRVVRVAFVYTPLVVLFCFFNPIFRKGFARIMDDIATYYRILWLLPVGIIIGYSFIRMICEVYLLIASYKAKASAQNSDQINTPKNMAWIMPVLGVVMVLLIAFGGKYVYNSPYMSKAQNQYHLPQEVIELCDMVSPPGDTNNVTVCFPGSLVYFVRQYNSNILMPFGREMVEPVWDYYHPVYEVFEKPDIIDTDVFLEASRSYNCKYIVVKKDRELDEPFTSYELELVGNTENYDVYRDLTFE